MSAAGAPVTDAGEHVLRLSRQMHEAARDGAWARLAALHEQREPALRALCEGRLVGPDRLRAVLEAVLEADRETVALVMAAREDARAALARLGRGRHAIGAYHGASRG